MPMVADSSSGARPAANMASETSGQVSCGGGGGGAGGGGFFGGGGGRGQRVGRRQGLHGGGRVGVGLGAARVDDLEQRIEVDEHDADLRVHPPGSMSPRGASRARDGGRL